MSQCLSARLERPQFVWTGDGRADQLAKYAQGCDVFVSEMTVDMVNLWAMKQGVRRCWAADD
jgi:ribonuclease BN (tRNA processing enzyme)